MINNIPIILKNYDTHTFLIEYNNKKYLYLFNKETDTEPLVTLVENPEDQIMIDILLENPKLSNENIINKITKNMEIIFEKSQNKQLTSEEKKIIKKNLLTLCNNKDTCSYIESILNKLFQDVVEINTDGIRSDQINNTNITEQTGGFVIYFIMKAISKKFPLVGMIFNTILDILDLAVGLLASIPGLQAAAGVGFGIDLTYLTIAVLRFDIISIIAGLVTFIPVVGDVSGGVMIVLKNVFRLGRLLIKFIDYKHKDATKNISDITSNIKTISSTLGKPEIGKFVESTVSTISVPLQELTQMPQQVLTRMAPQPFTQIPIQPQSQQISQQIPQQVPQQVPPQLPQQIPQQVPQQLPPQLPQHIPKT